MLENSVIENKSSVDRKVYLVDKITSFSLRKYDNFL